MEIINMAMNDGKYASFKVGSWRWRVQEQSEGKWVLYDDWYDEEVVRGDSYEEAFKAMADYNEALEAEKEKKRQMGVETFNRVVKVIGAETSMTCVGTKEINSDYRISVNREYYEVFGEKSAHIKMSLVKNGKRREVVAVEFIEDNFTDKMIENRYNKLMKEMDA